MTDPARKGTSFAAPQDPAEGQGAAPAQPGPPEPGTVQPDTVQPGTLQLSPVPPDPAQPTAPLDWKVYARTGEWRRAQAAAHLLPAPGEISSALMALSALQEDVRGRKYPAAGRALRAYGDSLESLHGVGLHGEEALLRSLAAPELLTEALNALEAGSGEADPGVLQERLRPAEAHALTRAEAHNALGVLHALREEPEAARAAFERARAADPGHYRALMNLGNLDLEAGQPALAEACYREVLKLAPDYEGAHHNLGVALRRQGKVYASVGSIRRAQRLGVRRTQQDTREDLREQMRVNPKLRAIRWGMLLALALVIALIVLASRG